jgi:hypothetical protein
LAVRREEKYNSIYLPTGIPSKPKKIILSDWFNRRNFKAIIIIIAILVISIIIWYGYNLIVTYRQSISPISRESIITTIPDTPSINFEFSVFHAQIMVPVLSIITFFIIYIYLDNSLKKKRKILIADIERKVKEEISNINNKINDITSFNYSQIPSLYKIYKELKSKSKKEELLDEIEQSEYKRLEKLISIAGNTNSISDLSSKLQFEGLILNDEEKRLIRFVYSHKNNIRQYITELLEEKEYHHMEIKLTLKLLFFTHSELKLIDRYKQLMKLHNKDFDLLKNLSLTNLEKFEKDPYVEIRNLT